MIKDLGGLFFFRNVNPVPVPRRRLIHKPPATFKEQCRWSILWVSPQRQLEKDCRATEISGGICFQPVSEKGSQLTGFLVALRHKTQRFVDLYALLFSLHLDDIHRSGDDAFLRGPIS